MQQAAPASATARRTAERWLMRRGLPHFVQGYTNPRVVWRRALPFLAFVYVLEATTSVSEVSVSVGEVEAGASTQATGTSAALVFALGAAIVVATWLLLNLRRGRPLLRPPTEIGLLELGVFVAGPPSVLALFYRDPAALILVVFNLLVLTVTYPIVSYGVIGMLRWALTHIVGQLGAMFALTAKALPLLLLIVSFLFLTAEVWQSAGSVRGLGYVLAVALLLLVALAFLTLSLREEARDLTRFESWSQVDDVLAQAPKALRRQLSRFLPEWPDAATRPALDALPGMERSERINALVVLVIVETVQVGAVSLLVGTFLFTLGLVAVPAATVESWVSPLTPQVLGTVKVFSSTFQITEPLVRVSGFIAAFTALYFSVASVRDETYRREFYQDSASYLRLAGAVRVRYLADLVLPARGESARGESARGESNRSAGG